MGSAGGGSAVLFFLRIRGPPRSTRKESSAASDVYKRHNNGALGISLIACFLAQFIKIFTGKEKSCLLYTSPSPRD
ncbi:hypothetical protein CDFC105_43985 [Clostridioides difficile]|nr:hypothetical protein CDFC105_43985 [Clostridioides difficile]